MSGSAVFCTSSDVSSLRSASLIMQASSYRSLCTSAFTRDRILSQIVCPEHSWCFAWIVSECLSGASLRTVRCPFVCVVSTRLGRYPCSREKRKVRARSGSRILMLTAYGLVPVAPVWGRSEEERPLCVLPVACPLVDLWLFPILCIARIGGLGFSNWF